jgi:hypothetical protein
MAVDLIGDVLESGAAEGLGGAGAMPQIGSDCGQRRRAEQVTSRLSSSRPRARPAHLSARLARSTILRNS